MKSPGGLWESLQLSLHSDFKVCNLRFCVWTVTAGEGAQEKETMDRERGRVRDGDAEEENEAERDKVREGEPKTHERDRKPVEKKSKRGLIVWPELFSRIHQSLLLSPPIQMSRAEIVLSPEQKAFFLIIAVMPLTADWLTMRQPRGAWSAQLISCRTIVRGGFHSCTRAHARTCYAPSELSVGACDAFSTCWKLNYPDAGMPSDWKM